MYKFVAFLVALIILISARGQNTIGLPQIINFNSKDFKGGSQTWDIRQDKWGRMYFANNEGLLTYDGSYWKIYPQPEKSILRSIAIQDEKIFAGGQDEIGFYAPDKNGRLNYTSLKGSLPKNCNKFSDVWDIEVFKESVFFRTLDYIFEYSNGTFKVHKALKGWQFLKATGGRLIAQDDSRGLFQFVNYSWLPMCRAGAIPDFEVSGIVAINKDSLLVSSVIDGLFIFHDSIFTKKQSATDELLKQYRIYAFEQINSKEYLAATTSDGCYILDSLGQIVQKVSRVEGLQNNNVLSIFLDKDKNLWTGLDNGISFIAYNAAIKYIMPAKPNESSGYSSKIFENKLYIATSDGAYVSALGGFPSDLSFAKGSFVRIKNSKGQTWRLDEVNQQLMMGYNNGSVVIKNDEAIPLTADPGIWLFLPTTAVYPYKNVLAGTYAGLTMFEFDEKKLVKSTQLKGPYESLRFLAIDNENEIWASHPYRGIYKISLSLPDSSYTSQLYTHKDGLPSSLRNFVFRIKNRVVFATTEGIYEFDEATKKFIPSPLLYKVFGKIGVQYMSEDAEGNIWFCIEKGMGVVNFRNPKQPAITYFPELTGNILSGFENIYPYNQKNIFIGAKNGVIHLNYEKYATFKTKLNVLLTEARVFGKSDSLIFGGYTAGADDSVFMQSKNRLLKFPISENSFHFEFSSPSFSIQSNIEYSYQLVGYDDRWSPWSSKTEKDYTNLPSGTYKFNVKAHDNIGNESAMVSYTFVVKPAWYNTLWAYLFYFLLLVAACYLFIKWQQKKFKLQLVTFEDEQNRLKYIHQLEIEKSEKEIIKLQNEKLINEVTFKNKELVDANMHLVERSDALIKVKDELQQLYKKTGGNHDVKKAIQLVNDIEKNNSNWEQFASHFDEVNNDFLKKLSVKFPQLTNTDLKVCAYLQLKLTSKQIAQLMNITVRGVELSRYRLRKKLQLAQGQTLNDFFNDIVQPEV
jgi:ligand-binding sensor domain-containing protein